MIDYFDWLMNRATYGQVRFEEFKWGVGFALSLGVLYLIAMGCERVERWVKARNGRSGHDRRMP